MNPEVLRESGNLINQFGFPIFFGVIMIIFAFGVFRYFVRTLEKKDCDLKEVLKSHADERKEMQKTFVESFDRNTNAIRENTLATHTFVGMVTGRRNRGKIPE